MAVGKKKRERAKNLFETGSKAIGVIVNVQDTGVTINENPRLRMTFRIEPIDGSEPFEGQKKKTVSRAEIPRAGDRFPVWFDPNDHESWVYGTVDDEQGREQIRQMFGDKADQITGVGNLAAAIDPLDRLKKLDELRATGVLTDSEFETKKAELLAQL